jgi:hypothetical protein
MLSPLDREFPVPVNFIRDFGDIGDMRRHQARSARELHTVPSRDGYGAVLEYRML